jgi:hypothetical protein
MKITSTLIMASICLFCFSCGDSPPAVVTTKPKPVNKPKIASLDLSNLKEQYSYSNSDIKIKFGQFIFQHTYIHDRYEGQYRYNSAERGEVYITSAITVDAKSKDPDFPIICAFTWDGKTLSQIGTFDYNFSYWQDYGTYLGNNPDWGNDFAHTEKIHFDIGLQVEGEDIKSHPIYIMALTEPCISRDEDRFKEPTVQYNDGDCATGGDITSLDELKPFTLIKIIGNPSSKKPQKRNKYNKYGGIDYGFISPKKDTVKIKNHGYGWVRIKDNGKDTVIFRKDPNQ